MFEWRWNIIVFLGVIILKSSSNSHVLSQNFFIKTKKWNKIAKSPLKAWTKIPPERVQKNHPLKLRGWTSKEVKTLVCKIVMLLSHRQSQRKKKRIWLKKNIQPIFSKRKFYCSHTSEKKKLIPLINPKKTLNPFNQKFPLAPI